MNTSRLSSSRASAGGILTPLRVLPLRFSLLGFLLLSTILLSLGRAEAYVLEQARDAITDAARPVLELLASPFAGTRDFFRNMGQIVDLYKENERLRAENERLLQWKAAALRLEKTVERYQALLNVSLSARTEFVTGRVIGDSGGPFVRTFIVNAGREDGVKKGQGVIAGDGLIGRVIGTGNTSARILLLSDLNSRIPVVIEPGLSPAILAGDNSEMPEVAYLDPQAEIRPGDQVITSGDGGALPRGIPIGSIVSDPDGEGFRVRLNTPLARIDFVRVLNYSFPNDIDGQDGDFLSVETEEVTGAGEASAPDAGGRVVRTSAGGGSQSSSTEEGSP